jgi:hypothetical protein
LYRLIPPRSGSYQTGGFRGIEAVATDAAKTLNLLTFRGLESWFINCIAGAPLSSAASARAGSSR